MKSRPIPKVSKEMVRYAEAHPIEWADAVRETGAMATEKGITAIDVHVAFRGRYVRDPPAYHEKADAKPLALTMELARLLMSEADRKRLARLHCPRGTWAGARLFPAKKAVIRRPMTILVAGHIPAWQDPIHERCTTTGMGTAGRL